MLLGMANPFYLERVDQHQRIGIRVLFSKHGHQFAITADPSGFRAETARQQQSLNAEMRISA